MVNLTDALDHVTNNDDKDKEMDITPCSKITGKRSAEKVLMDFTPSLSADAGDVSATKTVKLKSVRLRKRTKIMNNFYQSCLF
jgi:hypothetical protein